VCRSGGANGLTFGLGGEFDRQQEESSDVKKTSTTTTVHGFYNASDIALKNYWFFFTELTRLQFPRVIIYLEPESLQLSDSCKSFLEKAKSESDKVEVLKKFFARFGESSPLLF